MKSWIEIYAGDFEDEKLSTLLQNFIEKSKIIHSTPSSQLETTLHNQIQKLRSIRSALDNLCPQKTNQNNQNNNNINNNNNNNNLNNNLNNNNNINNNNNLNNNININNNNLNNSSTIDWLQIDDLELAQQFCLFEFAIYRLIQPKECLNLAWSKNKELSPNIHSIIALFNKVFYHYLLFIISLKI